MEVIVPEFSARCKWARRTGAFGAGGNPLRCSKPPSSGAVRVHQRTPLVGAATVPETGTRALAPKNKCTPPNGVHFSSRANLPESYGGAASRYPGNYWPSFAAGLTGLEAFGKVDCTQSEMGPQSAKSRRKARCYPPASMILLLCAVVLYLNSLLRIVGKVCG